MIKDKVLTHKLNYQRNGYTANSTFTKEEVDYLLRLVKDDNQ